MKRKITCFCDNKFEVDIPTSVDFAQEEGRWQQILQGKFLNVTCPACGKVLKPEFPVHLYDSRRKEEVDLFFIPELDRGSYYRNHLSYQVKSARRVVIGYKELVEKLLIIEHELDDRLIEVIKYFLLNKALEEEEGESQEEVRIYFRGKEGGKLLFHAEGLKKDELAVLRIDPGMQERVAAQLEKRKKEEPYATLLGGPYVSINKLYDEVNH